jgi:hypothetical protein
VRSYFLLSCMRAQVLCKIATAMERSASSCYDLSKPILTLSLQLTTHSKHAKPTEGPMIIPALANKDWRKAAEELRAGRGGGGRRGKKEMYIPEASGGMKMASSSGDARGAAAAVADVDAINTKEVVGGLEQLSSKKKDAAPPAAEEEAAARLRAEEEKVEIEKRIRTAASRAAESEEQRALRELLGDEAAKAAQLAPELDAIMSKADDRGGPVTEEAAFKKDVDSRPDEVRFFLFLPSLLSPVIN